MNVMLLSHTHTDIHTHTHTHTSLSIITHPVSQLSSSVLTQLTASTFTSAGSLVNLCVSLPCDDFPPNCKQD
jgi:hypothetical protein